MKTTFGRRWLSLFLTLAMCLTLSPVVWADEGGVTVAIEPATLTLSVGDTYSPAAVVKENGEAVTPAADSLSWAIKDGDSFISLEADGTVRALSAGIATLTVTYTYTPEGASEAVQKTADCKVTVSPAPTITGIEEVKLNFTTLTLVEDRNEELKATVIPKWSDGKTHDTPETFNPTVNWESSGDAVTVDKDGVVKGVRKGSAVITATAAYTINDEEKTASATCAVTVEARMADLALSVSTLTIDEGKYESVTASPTPSDAVVSWSSDDPSVSADKTDPTGHSGSIYGAKPGKAVVTASIGSGDNMMSATLPVTVSGLELSTTNVTVAENSTQPLPMVTRYGNAETGTLNWQSSNPNVAQRSGNNIAGRSPGSATFTVDVGGNYRVKVNVTVTADSKTTVEGGSVRSGDIVWFSRFLSDFRKQSQDSTLSHLTGIYVDPSQGTLYYGYTSADEPNEGVAQRDSYYYSPGNGQKDLRNIVFVPNPQFEGGQVTISYTVISSSNQNYSCRILLNVDQSESSNISLTASNLTPARFNGNTFNRLSVQKTGSELDYVIFSLPAASMGTLYTNFISADNYGSKVSPGAMYRRDGLDDIVFVPAAGATGTVTVYYTARSTGGNTYSGEVKITIQRETVPGSGGPVYNIAAGATQTFKDGDFNSYCSSKLGLSTLSHIQFTSLPSSGQGTLYHSYRSASSTGALVRADISYYYGTRSPRLDQITFVPAADFTGTVRIPFTGWDNAGNRFSGNVEINVQGSGGGSGSIRYSCVPGRTVDFTLSDFTRLSQEMTGRTLNYIVFQDLPNRSAQGSLYHNKTRVSGTGTRYYNSSGSYRIKNLSFQAASGFTGWVDIPFVGYASGGNTFNGVLTIDSAGGGSGDTSLSYHTNYSTTVVFSRDDFNDISLDETGYSISSVKFSVPSTSRGDLYRNYRSTTSKGTRISSSSTSVSSSGLNQVAFVPASGFIGTVYIDYTATAASSGGTFTGTIEIDVEQPGATVSARYATRTAPVDFLQEDFRRSGAALSTIRFNALPSSEQGKLYYQYTSPTKYTRLADTGTSYRYATSGSDLISDLTFVPRAGFTGTVILPFTGTNSNRTTFSGEVVITVQPTTASTRFTDMGGYSSDQLAAVEYIYENGITVGISETQYGPELQITRGDFAVMIYRAFAFTPSGNSWVFNDVPPNAYYAQAVNTLYAKGIVSGVGNGDYAPTAYVSRQDATCMVQRAMRAMNWGASDGSFSTLAGYSDAASVAVYAQGAMALAVHQGYLPIKGSALAPRDSLTRIDMAQILHRVLTY